LETNVNLLTTLEKLKERGNKMRWFKKREELELLDMVRGIINQFNNLKKEIDIQSGGNRQDYTATDMKKGIDLCIECLEIKINRCE